MSASPVSATSLQTITIGTRKSALALTQTNLVIALLQPLYPTITFTTLPLTTTGDQNLLQPLSKIGTKSLFTKELEVALKDLRCDFVVHSLKDLPTTLPDGMCIGAILERGDNSDAVVMSERWIVQGVSSLAALPNGCVVGTSSVRRIAQLKRHYPLLRFKDIRGNLNSRLQKLDADTNTYDALILASAGLQRLNMSNRISDQLIYPQLFYAVGQGALAIEIRSDDQAIRDFIQPIVCLNTTVVCEGERGLMRKLEGGCSVPLGVHAVLVNDVLNIDGFVCSLDGSQVVSESMTGHIRSGTEIQDAREIGEKLAELMIEKGAIVILDRIREDEKENQAREAVAREAVAASESGKENTECCSH